MLWLFGETMAEEFLEAGMLNARPEEPGKLERCK
jgi:hypothetical protein